VATPLHLLGVLGVYLFSIYFPSMRVAPPRKVRLFLLLLALTLIATWFATAPSRNDAIEVQHQLGRMGGFGKVSEHAINKILALGPRAYPELRRIISWRETSASRRYKLLWNKAPPKLQPYLPPPDLRARLQNNLFRNLVYLGPIACRALAGAVCDKIDSGVMKGQEGELLRPLVWSIPESPRAVATLSNYLARGADTPLVGFMFGDYLWPRVPELMPLLAEWLRKPDAVQQVARGLELVGTNASFALPLLLQVAENAAADNPPSLPAKFHGSYSSTFDRPTMNRIAALAALGKIGVANDSVVAVLKTASAPDDLPSSAFLNALDERTSDDTSVFPTALEGNSTGAAFFWKTDLALAGFAAALELRIAMTNELEWWAANWRVTKPDPQDLSMIARQLSRLGKLGLRATPALPLLQRAAEAEGLLDKHYDPSLAVYIDQYRITAINALYKISPDHAAPFLPYLLEHYANREAALILRDWKSQRDRIIPAITGAFHQSGRPAGNLESEKVCALILVSLDADVPEARDRIYSALKSVQPSERVFALNSIWMLNQNPSEVLPAARELLRTLRDEKDQSALNVLEKMGDAARPAIPEIKAALHSLSTDVRDHAGRLLRKLAPEEMPPIVQ
jgi:hypothetical protein